MKHYNSYLEAERDLCRQLIEKPEFITQSTYEIFGMGFVLPWPWLNKNDHSRYDYAEEFFSWMMSGDTKLNEKMLQLNEWAKRFVDNTGLPESFSATYGWKIKEQLPIILEEVRKHRESRRGYITILQPQDHVVLQTKTTHEYPCTIGLQAFVRDGRVNLMVNMRSNNVYSVMPYDVYNFTRLQMHICDELKMEIGKYYHQINSAHLYKGDVRRLQTIPNK